MIWHFFDRVAGNRRGIRHDRLLDGDRTRMCSGTRLYIEDVDPGRSAATARVGMLERLCTVVARNQIGAAKMRLPTVPDGLRDGERRTNGPRMQTNLEFEHHLVERAFEHVRDVRTLDFVGKPPLVLPLVESDAAWTYALHLSNPIARRPEATDTASARPVPQNGSTTVPPGGQLLSMRGRIRDSGKVAVWPLSPGRT